jgi:hypothetical protein
LVAASSSRVRLARRAARASSCRLKLILRAEADLEEWFRRYPGLDRWYPVWDVVEEQAQKEACEDTTPKVFVPGFQQLYVEFRNERERDIKGQERT